MGRGGPSALTAPSLPQEAPLLNLRQNQQWICLETLLPDTLYELQVRVRPQPDNLQAWSPWSLWSPWSQPLAFRTRPEGTGGQRGGDGAPTGGGGRGVALGAAGEGGLGRGLQCSFVIISSLGMSPPMGTGTLRGWDLPVSL